MADAATGRRLLHAAGFRVSKRRVFEANTLFDTAAGTLWRSERLLRVRQTGTSGKLTFKGQGVACKYKSREELEIDISEPGKLCEILSRADLVPSFRYEKFRTEFARRGEEGVATLDETPVGVYLELEGRPDWIDHNAAQMGFPESAYITVSYYALYVDYCKAHAVQPSNMIFPARPSSSRPRVPSSESR